MTINVTKIIRKTMGWCPNANALASKRVMIALPVDEEFQPGEKGKDTQNFSEMGWANKYKNYVLLLTSIGIAGFAACLFVIKYLFEGFHHGVILKGLFTGIIYSAFSLFNSWKLLNRINQPEIKPSGKVFIKSFVYTALLMVSVLFLSFTIGKESPLEFMIFIFFPSMWIEYPLVVYWEQKTRKTIYLMEEKFMRWRPVAKPRND